MIPIKWDNLRDVVIALGEVVAFTTLRALL
jgi:hypothetical protein